MSTATPVKPRSPEGLQGNTPEVQLAPQRPATEAEALGQRAGNAITGLDQIRVIAAYKAGGAFSARRISSESNAQNIPQEPSPVQKHMWDVLDKTDWNDIQGISTNKGVSSDDQEFAYEMRRRRENNIPISPTELARLRSISDKLDAEPEKAAESTESPEDPKKKAFEQETAKVKSEIMGVDAEKATVTRGYKKLEEDAWTLVGTLARGEIKSNLDSARLLLKQKMEAVGTAQKDVKNAEDSLNKAAPDEQQIRLAELNAELAVYKQALAEYKDAEQKLKETFDRAKTEGKTGKQELDDIKAEANQKKQEGLGYLSRAKEISQRASDAAEGTTNRAASNAAEAARKRLNTQVATVESRQTELDAAVQALASGDRDTNMQAYQNALREYNSAIDKMQTLTNEAEAAARNAEKAAETEPKIDNDAGDAVDQIMEDVANAKTMKSKDARLKRLEGNEAAMNYLAKRLKQRDDVVKMLKQMKIIDDRSDWTKFEDGFKKNWPLMKKGLQIGGTILLITLLMSGGGASLLAAGGANNKKALGF